MARVSGVETSVPWWLNWQ